MKSALANEKIGDEALVAKTGKTWQEWFQVLDAAGAAGMSHTEIATWLCDRYGAENGWHWQMVTAGYEQERGLRRKHETPDGFEVSVSRTIAASPEVLVEAWTDEAVRRTWLPEGELTITSARPGKSLRARWGEGRERIDVDVYPKGERTQITVQHRRLPDPEAAERSKSFWKERLERIRARTEEERR
jgi:uncharacterized protein DUF4287